MLNKNNTVWFTMIEILIAITIFFIITISSFSTYIHYQKKAILQSWIKEITQSLYEARNLAINWLNSNSENLSVWLYFDSSLNELTYYTYDHYLSWSSITLDETTPWISILKTRKLDNQFFIENIMWQNNWMFFFKSISWKWDFFYYDVYNNQILFWWTELNINVSYWHAISGVLRKNISYFTKTYITDY